MVKLSHIKLFGLAVVALQLAAVLAFAPIAEAATYKRSNSCSSSSVFKFDATVTYENVDRDTARPTSVTWTHNPVLSASMNAREQVGSTIKKTWSQSAGAGTISKTLTLSGSVNGPKDSLTMWFSFSEGGFACSMFVDA